jgi:transposase
LLDVVKQDRDYAPLVLLVTAGEHHDQTAFTALMDQGNVKRVGRGRPRRVVGDKGYSSWHIREWLQRHGIQHTIAHKGNEHRHSPFNRNLYRERTGAERLINRLKQYRRIAKRYEKRAVNFLAMVTIAVLLLWL